MKKQTIIKAAIVLVITSFMACSGDHPIRNGQDTAQSQSQVQGSGVDTSRTTTTTGDASNIDNSASGGTMAAKDSSNLKVDTVKK